MHISFPTFALHYHHHYVKRKYNSIKRTRDILMYIISVDKKNLQGALKFDYILSKFSVVTNALPITKNTVGLRVEIILANVNCTT